jgi:hypothetical protein
MQNDDGEVQVGASVRFRLLPFTPKSTVHHSAGVFSFDSASCCTLVDCRASSIRALADASMPDTGKMRNSRIQYIVVSVSRIVHIHVKTNQMIAMRQYLTSKSYPWSSSTPH